MAKKHSVKILMLLIVVLCSCAETNTKEISSDVLSTEAVAADRISDLDNEIVDYVLSVQNFIHLDAYSVYEKLNAKESFFLYTGRVTCEWCRKLVPVLCEISQKNELTIFYLDSENTEGKTQLKEFRDEFGIDNVPSIIFFNEDGNFEMISHNITDVSFDKKKLEKEILVYLTLN